MIYRQALNDTLAFLLDPELERAGFLRRRNTLCWLSPCHGGTVAFTLRISEDVGGWRVTPSFGVRFDAVEELFHRGWASEAGTRSTSMTLEVDAWRLAGDFSKDQFQVGTQDGALKAAAEALGVFDRSAQAFYQRYGDLAGIDAALNGRPEETTLFFPSEAVRAGRGLVVASMTRPEAVSGLAATYQRRVARLNAGSELPALLRLVELLDQRTVATR